MADLVDLGNERAEQQLGDILAARQRPATIVGSATCLHCGEELSQDASLRFPRRWCDSDCRDDWEKKNPTRKTAVPREPMVLPNMHPRGQIVDSGRMRGAHAEGCQGYDLRSAARNAIAEEAKFALKGHR